MTREQLYEKSIEVIKEGQHRSGGYVACPTFPTYNYSWFRDGSYIAYAMDLAGEHRSAGAFHRWAVENILKREEEITSFLDGNRKNYTELLHTRYTLEGEEGSEEWENFQLDSFGIWIWSMKEHLDQSGTGLKDEMKKAVSLVASYLSSLWQKNCYDSWEENSDRIHIYTLSTIYGGLMSAEKILGIDLSKAYASVKERILTKGCKNGHLVKYEGIDAVDSNLIGANFPCRVLSADDPLMIGTIEKIEKDLYRSGGLHRYDTDTYYGGGIWILLTAWLGIYYLNKGEKAKSEIILDWIVAKADADGHLAEQLTDSLNDRSYLPFWVDKWGESANPLLWSHAMYIILYEKLKKQ